jgi:holo-[acyl-carrier-protein] synthase
MPDKIDSQNCAVVGVGTDIVDVSRISNMIDKYGDSFLKKTFTDSEINYCSAFSDSQLHFAARFAAKEAMAKALGTGFRGELSLKGLSLENDSLGMPLAVLDSAAKAALAKIGGKKMSVSISHLKEYAIAFAVASR